eukprot:499241-Heterocapsa_arctica.AAC.1
MSSPGMTAPRRWAMPRGSLSPSTAMSSPLYLQPLSLIERRAVARAGHADTSADGGRRTRRCAATDEADADA